MKQKIKLLLLLPLFIQSCASLPPKYVPTGKTANLVIDIPFQYKSTLRIFATEKMHDSHAFKTLYSLAGPETNNLNVKISANKNVFLRVIYEMNDLRYCNQRLAFKPMSGKSYRLSAFLEKNDTICSVQVFNISDHKLQGIGRWS